MKVSDLFDDFEIVSLGLLCFLEKNCTENASLDTFMIGTADYICDAKSDFCEQPRICLCHEKFYLKPGRSES
jgi:hypothetical protein